MIIIVFSNGGVGVFSSGFSCSLLMNIDDLFVQIIYISYEWKIANKSFNTLIKVNVTTRLRRYFTGLLNQFAYINIHHNTRGMRLVDKFRPQSFNAKSGVELHEHRLRERIMLLLQHPQRKSILNHQKT